MIGPENGRLNAKCVFCTVPNTYLKIKRVFRTVIVKLATI